MSRPYTDPMPGEETEPDGIPVAHGPIPRAVWLLVALNVLLMTSYSMLVPTYRGPDEPQHVDLVLALQHDLRYPSLGSRYLAASIRRSMLLVDYAALQTPHLTAAAAIPRGERPPLANDVPPATQGIRNQLLQHPPLYYWLQAVLSRSVTRVTGGLDAWPFDRFASLLRLVDVLLLAPLPLLAYAVARRLGAVEQAGVAAAAFPLAIPELSHFGGIVNNDDLLILLFGVCTLLLTRVMTGDLTVRTAVLTGVAGGLALFTKGFALVFPAWALLAYLASPTRRGNGRLIAGRLGIVGVTAFAFGGWWWLRNLVVYGTLQPTMTTFPPVRGFRPDTWWWIRRFAEAMTERFWSWIGGSGGRVPAPVFLLATAISLAGIGVAIWTASSGRRRAVLAILLLPIVANVGIVALPAYRAYARSGATPALQGRYLFPGVVALAAIVAIGLHRALGRNGSWLPLLTVGAAAVIQGFAVTRIMGSFWGPEGASIVERVRAMLAWSPWPAAVVLAVLLAVPVLGALTFVQLRRDLHAGDDERPGGVERHVLSAGIVG